MELRILGELSMNPNQSTRTLQQEENQNLLYNICFVSGRVNHTQNLEKLNICSGILGFTYLVHYFLKDNAC